jgi:cob(I)alamin adenosyltransferase
VHLALRCEKATRGPAWHAIHQFGGGVNSLTAKYLNRLSDLLFVLARFENKEKGDVLWVPGANR